MPVEVQCSSCGHRFRPLHVPGRSARCPECNTALTLPDSPYPDEAVISTRFMGPGQDPLNLAPEELDDPDEDFTEDEDEVEEPIRVQMLQEEHPELYGALLSANQKLESAGGTIMVVLLALGGLTCLATAQKWMDDLFKTNFEWLRVWWGYASVMVIALIIGATLSGLREKQVFGSLRAELFQLMEEAGLSKYVLISTLEGTVVLSKVSEQLKKD